MKNKSCVASWVVSRMLVATSVVVLMACAGSNDNGDVMYISAETPTVDYVEQLDVYSAPHKDSFLNQLAMNYRSYAIYNARTSGYPDMGELFAQKAVAAFSGELPYPEVLDNWPVENEQESFELYTAYSELLDQLKNDASDINPELAAEAQAKYDCWLSAAASGQTGTAQECRARFQKTMTALRDCRGGKVVHNNSSARDSGPQVIVTDVTETEIVTTTDMGTTSVRQPNASNRPVDYYPDTRSLSAMNGQGKAREGVIIVNNVNVPEHLINPVPVQPMVFNQNIYGGDKTKNVSNSNNDSSIRTLSRTASNNNNDYSVSSIDSNNSDRSIRLSERSSTTTNLDVTSVDSNNTTTQSKCEQYDDAGNCEKFMVLPVMVGEEPLRERDNGLLVEPYLDPLAEPEPVVVAEPEPQIPMVSEELVTREEFINMMMAMRAELAAINARLDDIQAAAGEKTMIKVQQIPLEPKQHVMEEILEVRFDFNKATIKPEYQELIQKLATATQENKNIKVSVVGHTDTMGTSAYNYALGGRRAEAVQKMLIQYGVPASQIVAVSAGEEGLAVPTPDGVANAANRRVRVVKEVHYTEPAASVPVAIEVEEVAVPSESCGVYGCME